MDFEFFSLEYFLAYGSILAEVVCFVCIGLACWRLANVLRDRTFMAAAVAMGICTFLEVIEHTLWLFSEPLTRWVGMKWRLVTTNCFRAALLALFLFFILFSVAAIRRGLQVRKAAEKAAGISPTVQG